MNRTEMKYFVDLGLVVSFLACFITGVVKYPGFLALIGVSPRSLPMFQMTLLHDRSGLLLGILVVLHFALNWRWVVARTKRLFKN
ncbi:MAG TPA: DUF4405 domain-containing protein [Methanotrichaceae archaeon]|nr:DUF4405 domain-containing protein [Methanotrichaceae archaeon]